jgi:histidine triad (HIT) family protein
MSSVFSKIVRGEIPCYKIAEDEHHLAFLDVQPLMKGHTLVIPKKETDYIFDLEDDALANLHVFAKKVAIALKKGVPCQRIGMTVIGLEVPHAHIHLIPFSTMSDMNFAHPKLKLTKEEFETIVHQIRAFLP